MKHRIYFLKIRCRLFFQNQWDILLRLVAHRTALLGGIIVGLFILLATIDSWIVPHNPLEGDLFKRLLPPFWVSGDTTYLFGGDELGRDIFSRIIAGAKISINVGFLSVAVSILVGTMIGAFAGFYRGWFDELISRFAEILLAFPFLIFAIGVMAMMGPGFWNLIFALTFKGWVEFFRLIRGEVMSETTKEYVEAARAAGQKNRVIIMREILPNVIHSLIVLGTLRVGYMIIMEASLSFLGLGIQPPTPAWGSMVNSGRPYMLNAWWISTFPGLAILTLVLSINLLGEGLRDILDPRLKVD
ncbi:MAG: ABC transporter permease [Thermodesulfobacteriota bacterium]|nr:ABC transporter permease [Thermodesulfobacteriota bacterium]